MANLRGYPLLQLVGKCKAAQESIIRLLVPPGKGTRLSCSENSYVMKVHAINIVTRNKLRTWQPTSVSWGCEAWMSRTCSDGGECSLKGRLIVHNQYGPGQAAA